MRPTLRILDDDQYQLVLDEALRILAEVGVRIAGPGMRSRLLDAGFIADASSGRILFPPDKVRDAIASTPGDFMLYDRAGDPYAEFGVGQTHFSPGSSGLNILDHRDGAHREATSADFIDYIKIGHQLRHIRLLATAFSSQGDRAGRVGCLAPVPAAAAHHQGLRLRRLHRARRARGWCS